MHLNKYYRLFTYMYIGTWFEINMDKLQKHGEIYIYSVLQSHELRSKKVVQAQKYLNVEESKYDGNEQKSLNKRIFT